MAVQYVLSIICHFLYAGKQYPMFTCLKCARKYIALDKRFVTLFVRILWYSIVFDRQKHLFSCTKVDRCDLAVNGDQLSRNLKNRSDKQKELTERNTFLC